jgi:hypothetical protein
LTGKEEGQGEGLRRKALRDAFLELHREPAPESTGDWERREALTFPSCNPVKRIDFVMYKNRSAGVGEGAQGPESSQCVREGSETGHVGLRVVRCGLLGQEPTPDTAENAGREGIGMLDLESPVWASDHRAVYADFVGW